MTKRTGNAEATQAGNATGVGLAEALTPLIAGMTATRTRLLEWVHTLGIDDPSGGVGNGGYSQGEPTGHRASPRPYYPPVASARTHYDRLGIRGTIHETPCQSLPPKRP
jgi:hypothetical protein